MLHAGGEPERDAASTSPAGDDQIARLIIAAVAACAVAGAALAASAQTGQPTSRITITATLDGVRVTPGVRSYEFLLWNRDITPVPIGHAFTVCPVAPGGVKVCTSTFTLPHGRLVAVSETHALRRVFGIVVGGSRSARAVREEKPGYSGAEGTYRQTRIGPGTFALSFRLQM